MAFIREELRMAGWLNFLLGLWLILAPFALGFAHLPAAMWSSIGVGVAMMIVALLRMIKPLKTAPLHWLVVLLGVWLMAAPFVLGFTELMDATLSHVIVGMLAITLAAGSAIGARWGTE